MVELVAAAVGVHIHSTGVELELIARGINRHAGRRGGNLNTDSFERGTRKGETVKKGKSINVVVRVCLPNWSFVGDGVGQ